MFPPVLLLGCLKGWSLVNDEPAFLSCLCQGIPNLKLGNRSRIYHKLEKFAAWLRLCEKGLRGRSVVDYWSMVAKAQSHMELNSSVFHCLLAVLWLKRCTLGCGCVSGWVRGWVGC